jgi:hypothetical protein
MQLQAMFYTQYQMKRSLILLFCMLALPALAAVTNQYQKGKVVDVQQKVNMRVLYYQVNTPITQDDPYYEVSVQLGDTTYVGQFTPRHVSDTLPEDLVVTADVEARIDKRHMFLKRPSGIEMDLPIVKKFPSKPVTDSKAAAPTTH